MTDRPPLSTRLTERPASIGTFFKSKSPWLAESLGESPLDFLLVDRQHTSVDLETVEAIVRAADAGGLPVVVRTATTEFDFVNNLLDAGAAALMVPQVEGPDAVRSVRSAASYDGDRSLSRGTRAGQFGNRDREEHLRWPDEGLAVVPQIETEAGLERVGEIAAADGTTALMVGPTDLSLAMGVPKDDPDLRAAVDRVVAAARDAGRGVGIFASTPEELAAYREAMDFVVYGTDAGLVVAGLEQAIGE